MPNKQLTQDEIIRRFAATPPGHNSDGTCVYCGMPLAEFVDTEREVERGDQIDVEVRRTMVFETPAPHRHFPDCAWRNAVLQTEKAGAA